MSVPEQHVVIVGAGPIGLTYAWGIKQLNPDIQVTMFERYEEYQRKHTLVMQHKQLRALMKATEAEKNPTLQELERRLRADHHIRTTELENTFKGVAEELGVTIRYQRVEKDSIAEQIAEVSQNPLMIIGADGTHSVTSKTLFPEDNQQKHEFDFVMQLRFEVNSQDKAPGVGKLKFIQHMARHGLISNEYVGSHADGKTPITMQTMITRDEFKQLHQFTSKDPERPFIPFDRDHKPVRDVEIPGRLRTYLQEYLTMKSQQFAALGMSIDAGTVRISVNEAPATQAKQVVHHHNHKDARTPCLLVGDASLGLSYFKGLNAGLESAAKFFELTGPALAQSNVERLEHQMQRYQRWFLESFAPAKVKEVSDYSHKRINSPWKVMRAARGIKLASYEEAPNNTELAMKAYFDFQRLLESQGLIIPRSEHRLYPHRAYDPIKFAQLDYVPLTYTLRKTAKVVYGIFTPYKGWYQLRQDLKQPLMGLAHFFVGIGKFFHGLFTLRPKRLLDGLFNIARGALEIATAPVSWFVRPITRGLITLFRRPKAIEQTRSMQKLANKGLDYADECAKLSDESDDIESLAKIRNMLAIANDLHRKYEKGRFRHRRTEGDTIVKEATDYENILRENRSEQMSIPGLVQSLRNYFSVFNNKHQQAPLIVEDAHEILQSSNPIAGQ